MATRLINNKKSAKSSENSGDAALNRNGDAGNTGVTGNTGFAAVAGVTSNSAKGFFFLFMLTMIFVIAIYSVKNAAQYGNVEMEEEIKSYYAIEEEVVRLAKNLNRFIIYYGGNAFANLPEGSKVTEEDITLKKEELKYELLNEELRIEEEYFEQLQNSKSYVEVAVEDSRADSADYDENDTFVLQFDDSLLEKKNAALEALRAKYLMTNDELRALILEEKNQNYNAIRDYLKNTNMFTYFFVDRSAEIIYSNFNGTPSAELIGNDSVDIPDNLDYTAMFMIGDETFSAVFNGKPLNTSFAENEIDGYILIPKELPVGSPLRESLYEINRIYSVHKNYAPAALTSAALFIVCAIYVFTRHREDTAEVWNRIFQLYIYLPLCFKLLVLFFGCLFWLNHIDTDYLLLFTEGNLVYFFVSLLFILTPSFLYVFMSLAYVLYIAKDVRRIASNPDVMLFILLFNTFWDIVHSIPLILSAGNLPTKLLYAFLLFLFPVSALSFAVFALYTVFNSYILYAVISLGSLFVFLLLFILADLVLVNCKLDFYIERICEGSTEPVPHEHKFFGRALNRLNYLNEGTKKNLDKMLNSERTKAELITNVSHDLKTPLTSIITYVALLKNLPREQWEQADEYVQIIDAKSQRLKILIEDLFEAARLNSRSVELELERVDVIAILKQALGELDEKIQDSGLSFRLQTPQEHLYLMLDGRKIWRVFENLITNILKYSQPNTRVYIAVTEDETSVFINMKNTSAYEINFEAEELTERFIRGDKSRSTEGSGLGLSIAKDIIELHGGQLGISVDGDLFKLRISLNKFS